MRIKGSIENKSLSTTWVDLNTVFEPYSDPKKAHLGPKKEKRPQNQVKIKSRIKENIENKSLSTTWVDPKTAFQPYPDLKNSSLGPQKVINDQKLSENQKLELKEL